jgi:hypothetical protein
MNLHEDDAGFMTVIQQIKQEVYVNNLSALQDLNWRNILKSNSNAMVKLTWLNVLKLFPGMQCILTHFTKGRETQDGLCKNIRCVVHHHASTRM